MMELALTIASWTALLAGSLFLLCGGIGILRFPNFYTRLHAAGVTDTMGAGLILLGLMMHGGFTLVTIKLILILGFLWFTSPTATHALAKAARHGKLEPLLGRSNTA